MKDNVIPFPTRISNYAKEAKSKLKGKPFEPEMTLDWHSFAVLVSTSPICHDLASMREGADMIELYPSYDDYGNIETMTIRFYNEKERSGET